MKKLFTSLFTFYCIGLGFGQTWQTHIPELYTSFEDIVAVDSNSCFAVGGKGKIYKTINGGNTWTLLTTGVIETLSSCYHMGGVLYVTVPKTGQILRSSDLQNFVSYQLNGYNGSSVYFFNEMIGYITSGQTGKIAKTLNGGDSWQIIETNFDGIIKKVYFQNEQLGFAIGQAKIDNVAKALILKTTDGGLNWETIYSEAGQVFGDITFTDATYGYVVGTNGKILRTTDGGTTFQNVISSITTMLNDITFANLYIGYAVGNMGTILKTTNRGATWQVLNYTQMSFNKVFFQGNIGWLSTAGNTILKSTNGAE